MEVFLDPIILTSHHHHRSLACFSDGPKPSRPTIHTTSLSELCSHASEGREGSHNVIYPNHGGE